MSTETTNKKIKIDNGTTFGRTYTDKAVDELLKNVGGGGISVIELTDKNGTIASAQLGKINANPQNFAFKYSGKILLFTKADSTTYQYCNNTTSSSDNNVMTTSTLLTIESSTGVYTIAENVHNVVANSIHPANGGDLTNIQVGSKVYSIPSGGGGIPTASINTQTFQLDTSSLTAKDNYVIASMDDGTGFISYVPLQTYFFNDGYFNKEVKMQTTSHDFRLSLTSVAFQSYNNYTLKGEVTNIDFTNTLDSTNTWTKLKDIKYIAIEEKNALTGESSHKYLEINSLPTLPSDASTKNYALNSVNGALTWNTIGSGLEIKNGALQATSLVVPTLPTDASSKTYTLKAVNGVLKWVE